MQRAAARKVRETGGPTVLTVGAIADGEIIGRSGTGLVGTKVSLVQLANMTSDRLLGRDTASAGAVEELTVTGGLEFSGSGGIRRSALTGNATAPAGSNTVTVVGLTETGGPTSLLYGAIADQEQLYRDSTTVKGTGIAPPKSVTFTDNGGTYQSWTKPLGHTRCRIFAMGGGGGGGAGATGADGTNRRGGGGGAAATRTAYSGGIPAGITTLYVLVGQGGAGSATTSGGQGSLSTVTLHSGSISGSDVLIRSGASGTGANGGLAGDAGGTGGAAGTTWNGSGRFDDDGAWTAFAGQAGATGGLGAVGGTLTPTTWRVTAGAGGGGRASAGTDFAGGPVATDSDIALVAGGTTGSGAGGNGAATAGPVTWSGGGGGGSGVGTGGTGGNAALGSGGGGGGVGVAARGVGGNGGAGLVIIESW